MSGSDIFAVKHFSEEEVNELLPVAAALEAVETATRAQAAGLAVNLMRRRLRVPEGAMLHDMAAAVRMAPRAGNGEARWYTGFKIYTSGREGAHFLVGLFAGDSGQPLAWLAGDRLGQRRTGAASGVATCALASRQARRLAVVGAGWQAESQLAAIHEAVRLETATVYSRRADARARFAARMSDALGIPVTPAASVAAALEGAGIVVTATTAREPVIPDGALAADVHINAIGANSLQRAELEAATVRRARRIVVDSVEQCRREAGDLVQALGEDAAGWERVEELSAATSAPAGSGGVTIFKSVGLAIWDVAAAARIYEAWREQGA